MTPTHPLQTKSGGELWWGRGGGAVVTIHWLSTKSIVSCQIQQLTIGPEVTFPPTAPTKICIFKRLPTIPEYFEMEHFDGIALQPQIGVVKSRKRWYLQHAPLRNIGLLIKKPWNHWLNC